MTPTTSGEIDTDGRDLEATAVGAAPPVEKQVATTSASLTKPEGENADLEKDLCKRFSNYGWMEPGQEADPHLQCSYPDGKSTEQFCEIRITKVTKPGKKKKHW